MIDQAGPGGEARSRTPAGRTIRLVEVSRHFAVVGIAGVATGVIVGGVGGRVVMRISAIAAPDYVAGVSTEGGNVVGEITVGGTLALFIFVGIFGGLVGAVAFAVSEPWLPRAGRWRGLAFGFFLLAIGGFGTLDPENRDFRILGHQELNVAMFLALFICFGVLVVPLIARLDRVLPHVDRARPIQHGWAYLLMGVLGLQFVPLFFFQFFNAEASGVDRAPVAVGFALIGVAVSTLLVWTRALFGGRSWNTFPGLAAAGYGFLLIATALGSARTFSDIGEILTL